MLELLNDYTAAISAEDPWLLPLCLGLFGLCVGSYLNVVIYRLPLGLSTSEPRRSFCPNCKAGIPWYHNLPVLSWLLLRGRSACCQQPISPRYLVVEACTGLLFAGLAYHFAQENLLAQIALCVWAAAAVAIFCIDAEKMIVLPSLTLLAAAAGLTVRLFAPWLNGAEAFDATEGALFSLIGAGAGFIIFKAVGLIGRALFGHKQGRYSHAVSWQLSSIGQGAEEDILLTLPDCELRWSELFMESSNRLALTGASVQLAGHEDEQGTLTLLHDRLRLPSGQEIMLEAHESLRGQCQGWQWRHEALGSGDAWIALAIGALCGWQGVLAALVGGSFVGIAFALIARIRRAQPLPFGPCLLLATVLYLLSGGCIIS